MPLSHNVITFIKKITPYWLVKRVKDKFRMYDTWRGIYHQTKSQLVTIYESVIHGLFQFVNERDIISITNKLLQRMTNSLKDIISISDLWRGVFTKPIEELISFVDYVITHLDKIERDVLLISEQLLKRILSYRGDVLNLVDTWRANLSFRVREEITIFEKVTSFFKRVGRYKDLIDIQEKIMIRVFGYKADEFSLIDSLRTIFRIRLRELNTFYDSVTSFLRWFKKDIVDIQETLQYIFKKNIVDTFNLKDRYSGIMSISLREDVTIYEYITQFMRMFQKDLVNIQERLRATLNRSADKDSISLKDSKFVRHTKIINEQVQGKDYVRKKTSGALTFPITFPGTFGEGWTQWEEI